MTIRFLADEDLRAAIMEGLRSREPAIDILDVKTAGLRGMKDPAVLELAAQQDRIVISHDREAMTRYFRDRLDSGEPTTALFIVPQEPSAIGEIIESLLLVWAASSPRLARSLLFGTGQRFGGTQNQAGDRGPLSSGRGSARAILRAPPMPKPPNQGTRLELRS